MSMTREEVDEVMEIFWKVWLSPGAGPNAGALHAAARAWYYEKMKQLDEKDIQNG